MTEFVTPQLRTVLKTYQNSATKSLQGPGQSLSHPGSIVKKEISSPEPLDVTDVTSISVIPPPPEISQPILSQPDTGRGELYETILEGKPIGCFLLGGEMRLCLPQFLNNVLTDFTLDQINRIFDDLRIFCSQCTPEQLMEFKAAKILPDDVKASGLITRTDAERLCAALLHRSDRCNIDIPKGAFTFKVYHRCFGKCEGICTPDLYSFDKPACIMCLECKGMFSPQKFVGHVHRQKENRTCHWGFDSRNWRDYLLVGLDVENRDKCAKMLDELRDLEQQEILNAQRDMSCLKRKAEMMEDPIMEPPLCKREPLDIPSKKAKIIDESSYLLDYQRYQQALYYAHCAQREQLSAFRPWAPKPILHLPFAAAAAYFSQEPPVLQNPERVVRHSESERFERTFQPNVALAPRKSILSKEREREKEKERERDRERNHSAITNLTISETEIHIKQERPSTPDVIAQSPEEMRITSPTNSSNNLHQHRSRHHHHSHSHQSHNQCTTSTTMSSSSSSSSNTNNNHHTTPAPVSPEEFSGSNEITSSTSPVPNTNINNNGCNNTSTPTSNTQQQTTAIVATINQKTADNNMIVCVPSRIHLNNISNNSADAARSPTPPSIREQYSINNNIKTRTIQLQSPPQSSSSLSSNAVGLTTSGAAGSVVVKNVVNGAFIGATTNSEFELSTDTDEDSLIGEPDSSNMTAPWDIAADALKDAQPSDRDKVLQVIKMLVHDNNQLRQYGLENAKLLQEIRHRDERIAELQQELQHHQRQLALFSPQSSISASTLNSIKQKMSGNGGVIAKAESCLTLRNDLQMMSSAYHQKPEQEKIKVPLKKSSRRSPEDTVVVLNQNLHRDEVITEIKTVELINTCSSPSAKSLPASNTTNSTSAATTTSSSPDSAEYELKQQQQHQQQQQQQHQQQQQQQQRDVASIKCE